MKFTLLAFAVLFPLFVQAQEGYSVPKAELTASVNKSGITLDLSKDESWKKNAKITFENLGAGDFANIEVKLASNETKFAKAAPDANDGKAIFDVSKLIAGENKDCAFNIYFSGTLKGSAAFKVIPSSSGGEGPD